MSRIRFSEGKIIKTTKGEHNIYSDGNITYTSSGSTISHVGVENGVTFGEPKKAPPAPLLKKYFVEGWWSSDEAGDKRIKEALVGDHVYFHIKTKDIPNGEVVQMKLYDDDNNEKNEPKEKGKDNDDFRKMINTQTNQEVASGTVKDNKVVKSIILENFESFIKDETDKQIELYYRCSYKTENVEFPRTPSDYLKVTVDTIPQLIFVNGHWNRTANALGMSPGAGGDKYWDYFLGRSKERFIKDAETHFSIKYKNGTPYFFDGSSFCGVSSSGSERKLKGKEAAKEKFEKKLKGMRTKTYYFISHSEGGAFAAGVAEYLAENGVTVGEHIMLSCDEADEFTVNNNVPTYQLTPCYLTKDYSIVKKVMNLPRFIFHSQQIKKIRDYYIIVDWVVGDYQLKGAIKYGVVISKTPNVDWMSLHADLIDIKIFKQLDDLKKVRIGQVMGEYRGEFYSGYAQYDVDTRFYRIQDDIILDNIPKN
jgi:hypothetical protein